MKAFARLGHAALGAALLAPLLVTGATPAGAAPVDPPARITPAIAGAKPANSMIVGVSPTAGVATQNAIARSAGADQVARLSPTALQLSFAPGAIHASAAQVEARSDVSYAEPNTAIHSSSTPNDPGFGFQWSLQDGAPGVGAPTAWSRTTGSPSIVVGVLDSGIDLLHPDLQGNLWRNPGGIGGCPAGTFGIDVVDTRHPNCTPQDRFGHGTHVAGTIGAVGNNGEGVTGVNWTTRMMAVKVLDDTGSGSIASAVAGIEFAVQAKQAGVDVRVVNASWGDDGTNPPPTALHDEIVRAGTYGILFVAAAGNAIGAQPPVNLDTTPQYPCSFKLANEICVAATTNNPADTLADFSNYGPNTVDLAAPGVDILSTYVDPDNPDVGYASGDGTSFAAPHVAGAAALMLSSQCVSMSALKTTLLANVQPVAALNGLVATGGRLDLGRAVGPSHGRWCAFDTAPPLSGGLTSGAAVSSWAPGRLDVFTRNSAGHLAHTFSAGYLHGWEDLGGGIQGTPAAVSWSNGRIDVFARGTDNQLWHKWYAGAWSGWEPLGGSLNSGPTVASWSAGRLDVFARGTDNQLWHKWFSGSWSGWQPLGGRLGGDPAAVSWSTNRIDIAARGTDGQVWHKWYSAGWSGWEPLGGAAVGGTGLSARRPGVLDIFVTGTDGHLWHKWYDGAWHGFENLGGSLDSGPNAVSWSPNRIDVVAKSGTDLTSTYWEP